MTEMLFTLHPSCSSHLPSPVRNITRQSTYSSPSTSWCIRYMFPDSLLYPPCARLPMTTSSWQSLWSTLSRWTSSQAGCGIFTRLWGGRGARLRYGYYYCNILYCIGNHKQSISIYLVLYLPSAKSGPAEVWHDVWPTQLSKVWKVSFQLETGWAEYYCLWVWMVGPCIRVITPVCTRGGCVIVLSVFSIWLICPALSILFTMPALQLQMWKK